MQTITLTPNSETRPTIISGNWIAGGQDLTSSLSPPPPAWDTRGPLPVSALRAVVPADVDGDGWVIDGRSDVRRFNIVTEAQR